MIRIYEEHKEVKAAFERALPILGFTEKDNLILVGLDKISQEKLDEIREMRDTPVIFYSFLTEHNIIERKQEVAALLCRKYAGFIRLPFLLVDIRNLYDKLVLGEKTENKAAILKFEIERKRNLIGRILHDIAYEAKKEQCLALAKKEFNLKGIEEEMIEKLNKMREETNNYFIKEFSRNEILNGVFCDIQGTLVDFEGNIRKAILEMLKNYEAQGKSITLWTGGSVKDIKMFITENIIWPLLSKDDFVGCEVEIVIDDMPEEEFSKIYRIKYKEYIRV